MDLNARVDVNCGRKDAQTDGLTDGRTENRTPISHLAKAGATKIAHFDIILIVLFKYLVLSINYYFTLFSNIFLKFYRSCSH